MRELRPHQTQAIDLLRQSLRSGRKRPILQIPTGGGKTFIAATIIKSLRERGKRALFIVDALSLIDQTVEAFYSAGLHSIGVIQADHVMTDWSKPVQIASVQTLSRRGMCEADLVIVDEAHSCSQWLHDMMTKDEWAKVPFIGLTATPWAKGLGLVYDDLIIPVTMEDLIEAGYLSTFRVFAAAHPDLAGVGISKGDYKNAELAEAMQRGELVADIVTTWIKLGDQRPTFAFCVDRAHAKKVQKRFEDAGIGCGYIDAFTPAHDRKEVKRQLDAGEIKIVANVGCLTKGVDWIIGTIILARPTKSEMLYVQMVGRGLRVNPGIDDCIILDHADNTVRMGFVTDIRHDELCTARRGEKAKPEKKIPLPKECPKCTFLKPPKTKTCPICGFEAQPMSAIDENEGELVQVKGIAVPDRAAKQHWISGLLSIAEERGYKKGWAMNKFKERFGVWPDNRLHQIVSHPTPEILSYVRASARAWAKSQKSA